MAELTMENNALLDKKVLAVSTSKADDTAALYEEIFVVTSPKANVNEVADPEAPVIQRSSTLKLPAKSKAKSKRVSKTSQQPDGQNTSNRRLPAKPKATQPAYGQRSSRRVALARSKEPQVPIEPSTMSDPTKPPLGEKRPSRVDPAKAKAVEEAISKTISDLTQRAPKVAPATKAKTSAGIDKPKKKKENASKPSTRLSIAMWKDVWAAELAAEEDPAAYLSDLIAAKAENGWKALWAADELRKLAPTQVVTPAGASLGTSELDQHKTSTYHPTSFENLVPIAEEKEELLSAAELQAIEKADEDDIERAKWWSPHGGHKHEYYKSTGQS